MSERIVIIGAGHAGFNVVEALRRLEFDGEIILVGDEPHLPYQRPPLSKAFLTGDYDLDRLLIRPAEYYTDNKITLKLGDPATLWKELDPKHDIDRPQDLPLLAGVPGFDCDLSL